MTKYLIDDKPSLEELAHHGVKGMRWGSRKNESSATDYLVRKGAETGAASKQSRAAQKQYLKDEKKRVAAGDKFVKKQFKADVKAAAKGQGVRGEGSHITGFQVGKKGEETSLATGKFVNSKGEKVSENYANLVLSEFVKRDNFHKRAQAGAIFAVAIAATAGSR